MRNSKSQGGISGGAMGISGLASKPGAYQRWIKTAHKRSNYVSATLNMANLLSEMDNGGNIKIKDRQKLSEVRRMSRA